MNGTKRWSAAFIAGKRNLKFLVSELNQMIHCYCSVLAQKTLWHHLSALWLFIFSLRHVLAIKQVINKKKQSSLDHVSPILWIYSCSKRQFVIAKTSAVLWSKQTFLCHLTSPWTWLESFPLFAQVLGFWILLCCYGMKKQIMRSTFVLHIILSNNLSKKYCRIQFEQSKFIFKYFRGWYVHV